jgi:hypothetical protein
MCFIFLLIGHRTQEILEGHESVTGQYDSAVYKLSQISNTANFFQDLMDKTRLVSVCWHIQFVVVVDQNHRVLPNLSSVHSLEVLSNV